MSFCVFKFNFPKTNLLLEHLLPVDAPEEDVVHDLLRVVRPTAKTASGVLAQQPIEEVTRLAGECPRKAHLLDENQLKEDVVVAIVEGQSADHHLVHDHAEAPPIDLK